MSYRETLQSILDEFRGRPASRTPATDRTAESFRRLRPAVTPTPTFAARLREDVLATSRTRSPKAPDDSLHVFMDNFSFMRKKSFLIAGFAVAGIILAVVLGNGPATRLGAEIVYAEGAVMYQTPGTEWREAEDNTTLSAGDGVKVVGDGHAIIILDDGSAVRLNSDSEATLALLERDHFKIINNQGDIYTRVVKTDRIFDVEVGGTTYRAMGTAYRTLNTAETKGVEVFQSSVEVLLKNEAAAAGAQKTLVPEGTAFYEVHLLDAQKVGQVIALAKETLEGDHFIRWNKDRDTAITSFKNELGVLALVTTTTSATTTEVTPVSPPPAPVEPPQPPVPPAAGIILSLNGEKSVSWTAPSAVGQNGFKLIISKNPNPTYPTRDGDKAMYVNGSKAVSWLYPHDGSGTYYIRVCAYTGNNACSEYSNEVSLVLTAPEVKPVKELNQWIKNESKDLKKEHKDEAKEIKKNEGSVSLAPVSTVASIILSVTANNSGLSWNASSEPKLGYQVVYSKQVGPTYPLRNTDRALFVKDTSVVSLKSFAGAGTYHVRVCEFLTAKTCGTYSNEVSVTIAEKETPKKKEDHGKNDDRDREETPSAVSRITLSAGISSQVRWTYEGGTPSKFKLISSKTSGPTYPARPGDKVIDVSAKQASAWLTAFDGSGTYYVRLCDYTGNADCDVYSNEIAVTLESRIKMDNDWDRNTQNKNDERNDERNRSDTR